MLMLSALAVNDVGHPNLDGPAGEQRPAATGERRRGVGAGDRADRGVRRRRAMGDRVARPQPALRGPRADGGGDLRRVGARDRVGPRHRQLLRAPRHDRPMSKVATGDRASPRCCVRRRRDRAGADPRLRRAALSRARRRGRRLALGLEGARRRRSLAARPGRLASSTGKRARPGRTLSATSTTLVRSTAARRSKRRSPHGCSVAPRACSMTPRPRWARPPLLSFVRPGFRRRTGEWPRSPRC